MDNILQKGHYRKTFYILIGVILLFSIIVRLFVIPYLAGSSVSWSTFFTSFFDNFIVTLIITVFIGSFIFWLTPKNAFRAKMEVIEAKEINPTLKSVLASTKCWIYKGTCGRYTRATTIPKLAEAARNSSFGRDITICLLNPSNEKLCNEYAIYRKSLKSANALNPWTKKTVQEEIIATVVVVLKYTYLQPLLRINVYFVDHFSAFRLDISDSYVIVTKEDKEASALKADAGTYFYDSYKDDVRLTERQSKSLGHFPDLVFNENVDESKLRETLSHTGFFDFSMLSPESIQSILLKINDPKDPY
ncbi:MULTISPECIES: hypothetical protein [unclassified Acinetobacter]|uniref:hypothetical protein n=1 Tax=unclassified Acinetobacter TaxID=196816 RepID=UPI0015D34B0F|nr:MULTISPECIES: hypothetical protein [unclassified Acinetobacter]